MTSSWSCPVGDWRQRADNSKRNLLDTDDLAERIFAVEKVVGYRFPEQCYFAGPFDVRGGERLTRLNAEVADDEIVRSGTHDLGAPIVVAVNDLGSAANRGGREGGGIALAHDGFGVVFGEGLSVAGSHADAGAGDTAGEHDDQVAADGGDLFFDADFGAGADGHHGDDRRDSDDDAEHGEGGTHFINAQRAERDPHAGRDFSEMHWVRFPVCRGLLPCLTTWRRASVRLSCRSVLPGLP